MDSLTGMFLMGDSVRNDKPISAGGYDGVVAASKVDVDADGLHGIGPAVDTTVDIAVAPAVTALLAWSVDDLLQSMSRVSPFATLGVSALAVTVLAPLFEQKATF